MCVFWNFFYTIESINSMQSIRTRGEVEGGLYVYIIARERETDRERDRQTDRVTEREERETDRQTDRQRQTERERDRETDRERLYFCSPSPLQRMDEQYLGSTRLLWG